MSKHEAPPADIRLSEVLGALSYALDLTEGQPAGHCMRACWIGIHVGRAIGLEGAGLNDLYYAILLKDLGCSSNAARICELYLTDDRSFKHDFKHVGERLPQILRFVFSHTGTHAQLSRRLRSIANVLQNGGQISHDMIQTRCERGADIARKLRFSEDVAKAIYSLDEHWDGGGKPDGLKFQEIPVFAQIALLSQVADVFFIEFGAAAARKEIQRRRGSWFDPRLVDEFEAVSSRRGFWRSLNDDTLQRDLLDLEPARFTRRADEDYLDDIAEAFAQIVDSKGSFTHGHSERVSVYADLIAGELGYSKQRRRTLKRAALLHDIGKLGVSNAILDKPGKLNDSEWTEMRGHALHSETILSRIAAFSDLAEIGGAHHERLDGKGYPRGLTATQLSLDTRIVSIADVFDALTADRPYRAALSSAEALILMRAEVGAAFDARCFEALERGVRKSTGDERAA
jgi:HD-GYP domain-containing protein (c-di-GMP phosphodiesterase class II)